MHDADDLLARMRTDADSDWPYRLLQHLTQLPDGVEERHAATVAVTGASETLTERELGVVRCASRGLDETHIAEALGISQFTVKSHLKSIRRRLRAKNTTHACCEAIRQGLVP